MRTDEAKVNALVGENVRRLREARGLTRVALAARAGIDDSYLGKMERGARGTSGAGYARLARALGVELAALFTSAPRRSSRTA